MHLCPPTWPAALALAGMLLTGCSSTATPSATTATVPTPAGAPAPTTAASPAPTADAVPTPGPCGCGCRHWQAVVNGLDERRSKAYASAHPAMLNSVYVPGSVALRRDRATLLAWSARGIIVGDLHLDVLDLEVLRVDRRSVRLRVVDRLAPATATLPRGRTVRLPRDSATARVLELRRVAGQWRIASSRRARS